MSKLLDCPDEKLYLIFTQFLFAHLEFHYFTIHIWLPVNKSQPNKQQKVVHCNCGSVGGEKQMRLLVGGQEPFRAAL